MPYCIVCVCVSTADVHHPFSAPVDVQSYELCSDMIDVVYDVSCIYGARDRGAGAGAGGGALPAIGGGGASDDVPDAHSSSIIKLSNGLVLWFKGVAK